ncbi:hypothetical protein LguiA_016188 [Lonicera macranthoides]
MSIIEDSGECMIEKIDDSHGNSTGIFLPMADYANNMDLDVLNPLGNNFVLVQRLLYSKCSNYNIKEPLDRAISKLAEHGTIAIEVNDSMMNSESGVTIEVISGHLHLHPFFSLKTISNVPPPLVSSTTSTSLSSASPSSIPPSPAAPLDSPP